MTKITIAIPTYNRREYLGECIRSILNQTFEDFQILVFDNCSDYDIEKLLKSFGDDRIKLIKNEKNLGNMRNFIKIFNYPFKTDYLIVFHDDDTMHPSLLEKEVKILNRNSDVVFVGTGMNFIKSPENMNEFSKVNSNNVQSCICKDASSLIRMLLLNFDLCFDSVMYRTNILEDITPCNNKFFKWADRPYLVELSKKGKTDILKNKLVNYRIHKNQGSQEEAADKSNCLFELFLFYKENLPQPLSKKDQKIFYSFSTNNLILSGFSFSKNWQEYKKFLEEAKDKDLFRLKYLNTRGVYYFLKCIRKKYFQKNE